MCNPIDAVTPALSAHGARGRIAGEDAATQSDSPELVREVRRLIAELLLDGDVTLERVAARLGMPVRRLRDRLEAAGVRFNELLADYRAQLAKELLLKTDESIQVIVERTGFSEPSTFYRAFKRWVGETPVAFRKRGRPLVPLGAGPR
ncbi:Transcriptional activator NphR [compost metagenome]